MGKSQDLKRLNTQIGQCEGDVTALEEQRADVQSAIKTKQAELARLRTTRNALVANGGELVISEHAMLRYIQRVMGIDLDELAARVVSPAYRRRLATFTGIVGGDGFRVRIKDGVAVTIIS